MGEVQVMLRNSEQSTFKGCRQRWHWAYDERLKPKEKSSPLTFGTYIHACLERYYPPGRVRGPHPAVTARRLAARYQAKYGAELPKVKLGGKDENEEVRYIDAVELAQIMLNGYVDRWKDEDQQYEVIASEMTFQIDIYDAQGRYLYTAVGMADGLWRDLITGRLLFLETKTGVGLDPFGAPQALDEQSGYYISYCNLWLRETGLLKPDEEVDFVLFNRLAKKVPSDKPRNAQGQILNKNGSVSKRQPPPLFKREPVYRGHEDQVNLIERMGHEVREMRLIRQGKLAVYKNPDRHCNWCEFGPSRSGMCEVHESGGQWQAIRDEMFTVWDPYSAHELREERRS